MNVKIADVTIILKQKDKTLAETCAKCAEVSKYSKE